MEEGGETRRARRIRKEEAKSKKVGETETTERRLQLGISEAGRVGEEEGWKDGRMQRERESAARLKGCVVVSSARAREERRPGMGEEKSGKR